MKLRGNLAESLEIDWFDDVGFSAQPFAFLEILRPFGASENNDVEGAGSGIAFDAAQDLDPIQFRKLEVEQHQFRQGLGRALGERSGSKQKIERLGSVADDVDPIGQ